MSLRGQTAPRAIFGACLRLCDQGGQWGLTVWRALAGARHDLEGLTGAWAVRNWRRVGLPVGCLRRKVLLTKRKSVGLFCWYKGKRGDGDPIRQHLFGFFACGLAVNRAFGFQAVVHRSRLGCEIAADVVSIGFDLFLKAGQWVVGGLRRRDRRAFTGADLGGHERFTDVCRAACCAAYQLLGQKRFTILA